MNYGLSFHDLIVRVAEATRTASFVAPSGDTNDNRAQIPTDPYRLERCKRSINDALRWIVSFRSWRSLRRYETLTVDNSGTLPNSVDGRSDWYWLPSYLSGPPLSVWTVTASQGQYTTEVQNVGVETLTGLAMANSQTGRPQMACILPARPVNDTDNASMRWQLRIWPEPDGEYTMSGEFRIYPPPLVRMDDRSALGPEFDDLLVSASIWKYKSVDSSEPQERESYRQMALEAMGNAVKNDDMLSSQTVGFLRNSGSTLVTGRLSRTITLNGVQIAP